MLKSSNFAVWMHTCYIYGIIQVTTVAMFHMQQCRQTLWWGLLLCLRQCDSKERLNCTACKLDKAIIALSMQLFVCFFSACKVALINVSCMMLAD